MNNKHWSKDFFKQSITSVFPLKSGGQHQTDLITLVDGSKWICKKLDENFWLGIINPAQFAYTELVASQVAHQLGCTFSSRLLPTINSEYGTVTQRLIIPYCEGEVITTVTQGQAFLLGRLLAQLHSLKMPPGEATGFPPIILPKKQPYPTWLEHLVERCNTFIDYEADSRVISHRDIHLHNIIWQNEKNLI